MIKGERYLRAQGCTVQLHLPSGLDTSKYHLGSFSCLTELFPYYCLEHWKH
jgi:hypothetical protein